MHVDKEESLYEGNLSFARQVNSTPKSEQGGQLEEALLAFH